MYYETWGGGCPGCGGDPYTGGFWHYHWCPFNPNKPTFTPYDDQQRYGWICPKCGAVYAPYMPYCTNCKGTMVTYIYDTNVTTDEEKGEG